MATLIQLNGQIGSFTLKLHPNRAAAVAATEALIWLQLGSGRKSPWEVIQYPGSDSLRAKFMGARPRIYVIVGAVVETDEDTMRTELNRVMDLNATEQFYQITPVTVMSHDTDGLIVEDVQTEFIGSGTGGFHKFTISMRDLTTT